MKFLTLISFSLFLTCAYAESDRRGGLSDYDPGPDLSTKVGRGYAEIFSQIPNYRGIGDSVLPGVKKWGRVEPGKSGEKFRWRFGPMFYRGRLGENQVKVLVIGQEGAQDENVSDRSFTGGTGGRMQRFLRHLGVDQSYLFINTFIYTIKGQYSDYAPVLYTSRNGKKSLESNTVLSEEMWRLAQTEESPIVIHRHRLIDHVIESNRESLRLIIAVGGAARDSLATYIRSKGGECRPKKSAKARQRIRYGGENAGGNKVNFFAVDGDGNKLEKGEIGKVVTYSNGPYKNGFESMHQLGSDLESCKINGKKGTLEGLKVSRGEIAGDIRYVHVSHPGGGNKAVEFKKELREIQELQDKKDGWFISADEHNGKKISQTFDKGYTYNHIAPPRRDFRFGLPEVIGQGATKTTRRDSGRSLEIGGRGKKDKNQRPVKDGKAKYSSSLQKEVMNAWLDDNDYRNEMIPWEPDYFQFDPGPGKDWAQVFTGEKDDVVLDLKSLEKKGLMVQSADYGAMQVYRGRPGQAKVLILADQQSHDDLWVGRALMGHSGQELQSFLGAIGAGLDYVIIRTLPFDTIGLEEDKVAEAVKETQEWRNAVLRRVLKANRKNLQLVLTWGKFADEIMKKSKPRVDWVSVTEIEWDEAFKQVKDTSWDGKMTANRLGQLSPIARADIPWGMRRWAGTSGDRMIRSLNKVFKSQTSKQKHYYYKMIAPKWSWSMKAPKLSKWEVNSLEETGLGEYVTRR